MPDDPDQYRIVLPKFTLGNLFEAWSTPFLLLTLFVAVLWAVYLTFYLRSWRSAREIKDRRKHDAILFVVTLLLVLTTAFTIIGSLNSIISSDIMTPKIEKTVCEYAEKNPDHPNIPDFPKCETKEVKHIG